MKISVATVSEMTKPDNLLTGFILLLTVERRSGNLDHHPTSQFAYLMKLGEVVFIIPVWRIW